MQDGMADASQSAPDYSRHNLALYLVEPGDQVAMSYPYGTKMVAHNLLCWEINYVMIVGAPMEFGLLLGLNVEPRQLYTLQIQWNTIFKNTRWIWKMNSQPLENAIGYKFASCQYEYT
jgi:hypothetical protein